MANPQKENGHTDIANEILEAMIKTHWSSYEIQTVLTILRKTYGWHKKEDWISLSEFEKLTGIKTKHICRTVNKLIERHIISKNNKKISFNKNYDVWDNTLNRELPKQGIGTPQIGNKNTLNREIQKKVKETIQKKDDFSFKRTTTKNGKRGISPIQKINNKCILDEQGFIKRTDKKICNQQLKS